MSPIADSRPRGPIRCRLLPNLPIPLVLKGHKALVTGANSGIGKAIAIALGAGGADVTANYVEGKAAAHDVVDSIVAGG